MRTVEGRRSNNARIFQQDWWKEYAKMELSGSSLGSWDVWNVLRGKMHCLPRVYLWFNSIKGNATGASCACTVQESWLRSRSSSFPLKGLDFSIRASPASYFTSRSFPVEMRRVMLNTSRVYWLTRLSFGLLSSCYKSISFFLCYLQNSHINITFLRVEIVESRMVNTCICSEVWALHRPNWLTLLFEPF